MENRIELENELMEFAINSKIRDMQTFVEKYFLGFTTEYTKVKDIKKHTLRNDIDDNLLRFIHEFSKYKNRVKLLEKIVREKQIDLYMITELNEIKVGLNTILRSKKEYIKEKLSFYENEFNAEQIEKYNSYVIKAFRFYPL